MRNLCHLNLLPSQFLCTSPPALLSLPPPSRLCDFTPSRFMQLEEGEVDTERGRLFGFCYRRVYRQEMEERRERVRKENAEQRARLTGGGMRS